MRTAEQDIFFSLIRAALWHEEVVLPRERYSWQTVVDALGSHGMLPFVADALMSLPQEMLPEVSLQERVMKSVTKTVRSHYRLNKTVCEVFDALQSDAFHPVLLKGQGLAQIYPDRYVRHCGDIDIFIGKERFWEACDIVSRYCGGSGAEREECLTIHWSAFKDDIDIEVHQVAADTAIPAIKDEYNEWAAEVLTHSDATVVIDGSEISVPPAACNAIYVFEHLLKHIRVEGVGVRQFVDWLLCIKALEDPEAIRDTLVRFHLMDAWQVLGGILVWQLGLPKEAFPFWNERKARHSQGRNLQYVIEAGNLGHGTATAKGYYAEAPSVKRDILALRYYWHHVQFEYRLFPYDTMSKTVRRIMEKIRLR